MRKFWLLTVIMFLLIFPSEVGRAGEISIFINGQALKTEVAPALVNSRVLVPVRSIFEEFGAVVQWDSNKQQVVILKGGKSLTLSINNPAAYRDNQKLVLDVAPRIIQDRTMVPLRFIAEELGARVHWDSARQVVEISSDIPDSLVNQTDNRFFGINIGASEKQLLDALGEPDRRDSGEYGYRWWVYNSDYNRYLQVGVQDGRVVDIYTNSGQAGFEGIKVGSGYRELLKKFPGGSGATFELQGAKVQLTGSSNGNLHLAMQGQTAVLFYLDVHKNKQITAIRVMKPELLLVESKYSYQVTYYGKAPSFEAPALSASEREQSARAYERQILDLANTVRLREGLPLLKWNEAAAEVARGHSLDMKSNNYFSHISPTKGTLSDRMAGLPYRYAGENIAYGQGDAIDAHEGWMNSLGHRENILNKNYTTLGVGVAGHYYTQNFITPR